MFKFITRKSNILDLLCTNSDAITYKDMYVNCKLSDHNLVEFKIDIKADVYQDPIVNPYGYNIFEYNFTKDDDTWGISYEEVDGFDVESLTDLQSEDQLRAIYRLLEDKAEIHLEKIHCFKEPG